MEPSKYSIVCDFWKFPEEIKNKILIVSIDDFNYDTLSNDALLIILNQHKWNLDIPSELDFVKVSFEYSINIQREFDIHNLHSFPEIIPFRTKNIQYLKKFAEIDAKSYPFESLISIIYQNQKWPFVVKMKNSVIFLYNLDNIIQDLLYERYIKNQRPLVLRFSLLYKFIPKSLLSYLSSFFYVRD